ncbi:hypothetical protein DdX_13142 [Ditylenchus destructor]|uniref:Uncharacterized protein n=1 Tax=Ditylenchus destructor TaxID=166010 RepID=A0AAD4MTI5_9BILA|nr:hypothetical protein DdX_13142 [Ditylenchus destructor]
MDKKPLEDLISGKGPQFTARERNNNNSTPPPLFLPPPPSPRSCGNPEYSVGVNSRGGVQVGVKYTCVIL